MKLSASSVIGRLPEISRISFTNTCTGNKFSYMLVPLEDGHSIRFNGEEIGRLQEEDPGDLGPLPRRLRKPQRVFDWCWTRIEQCNMPDYIHITVGIRKISRKCLEMS